MCSVNVGFTHSSVFSSPAQTSTSTMQIVSTVANINT